MNHYQLDKIVNGFKDGQLVTQIRADKIVEIAHVENGEFLAVYVVIAEILEILKSKRLNT